MAPHEPTDDRLRQILTEVRTIAIVGYSPRPNRPSHAVSHYLAAQGYRVLPINPGHAGETALGERIAADLASIPPTIGPIHMVDIFRRSEHAGAVVDEAIATLLPRGLRVIWMQIGVIDQDAAARAEDRGLTVIMNRCPKIEHARLLAPTAPPDPA
ncbi:MAG: CoA-binding protein [Pseudomonadota bacterium]